MSDANEMSSLERERTEKRRYWRKHIAAWRRGGLSQSAYCRENNLSLHQFRYWEKRVHDHKAEESVDLAEIDIGMSDDNEINSLEKMRAEKRRYWKQHIAAWRRSGLSQSAYCRENNLSFHQFRYWKKRVHDHKADEPVDLVEIEMESCQISSKSPVASPMMLFITNRFSIRIEPDFNEDHLTRLIRVLERV